MSLQIQLKKSAVSQKQPFASDLAAGELALNYNADGPFLTCKDTAGAIRKLNNVWVAALPPTSPSVGDLWLDTSASTAVLKVYRSAAATWVNATTVPLATTSIYGIVQLASSADVTNGTSGKIVDAAQLQSKVTSSISTALAASPLALNSITVSGSATINGNLEANGASTTINSTQVVIRDSNIEIGAVASPTNVTADGGGLTLRGATDKTFNWVNATGAWTSSERISVPLGSAGSPSLTITGDPNTGLYSPGGDQLAIATAGQGRLFVDADGTTRIENSAVNGSPLFRISTFNGFAEINSKRSTGGSYSQLRGTYAGNATDYWQIGSNGFTDGTFAIWAGANALERARIRADGMFEVKGNGVSGATPAFSVSGSAPANSLVILPTSGNVGIGTASPGSILHSYTQSAGAATIGASLQNASLTPGTEVRLTFSPNTNVIDNNRYAWIGAINKTGSTDVELTFATAPGGGPGQERARIDASGRVGIGTASPTSPLTVQSASNSYAGAINIRSALGGTVGAILQASGSLFLSSNSSGDHMVIDSSGRVGIGTTSPSVALDVVGGGISGQALNATGTPAAYTSTGGAVLSYSGGGVGVVRAYSNAGGAAGTLTFNASGTENARIDSSGRLLVGTNSSITTIIAAGLQVQSTGASAYASIGRWENNAATPGLIFNKSRGGTVGTRVVIQSEDSLGEIYFTGDDGTNFISGASIRAVADGIITTTAGSFVVGRRYKIATVGTTNFTLIGASSNTVGVIFTATGAGTGIGTATNEPYANSMPGRLVFSTTPDATASPTERMRITSAGLVGIGTSTTTPWSPLSVQFGSNMRFGADVDGSGHPSLSLYRWQGAGTSYNSARITCLLDGSLSFLSATSAADFAAQTFTEKGRFDASGRLLVGASTVVATTYAGSGKFQLHDDSIAGAQIFTHRSTGSEYPAILELARSRGTFAVPTAVVAEDKVGACAFHGYDGTNYIRNAAIDAVIDGTPGTNAMPGRLVFSTNSGTVGASPTEKLRITNDSVLVYNQPAPAAINATATATIAELKNGIITSNGGTTVSITLPTGTSCDGGFNGLYDNMTFEWSVVNASASFGVVVSGNTGHTVIGTGTIGISSSGRFATRRTGAATWVTYRLSS